MTDFFMLEQIQKMIKAMPKPRLIMRKGVTVKGYFRPYMSLKDYTEAALFEEPEVITPVTVRFASVLGDKGRADTGRNIKSMAVKFHLQDQVYDMICQNIPVTMINKVTDLPKAMEIFHIRDYFDGIDSKKLWKYAVDHKECLNFVLMLYSHLGLGDSFININMFSVNTYKWISKTSTEHLVRYKWVPAVTGYEKISSTNTMTINTAEFIAGFDPDRAMDEVINKVMNNEFPAFDLHVQMVGGSRIRDVKYTDNTIIWNEKDAPYMCIGTMILDRIDESKADDDMVYFLPGNTIDGIELCVDELSQIMDFMFRTEAIERGGYM